MVKRVYGRCVRICKQIMRWFKQYIRRPIIRILATLGLLKVLRSLHGRVSAPPTAKTFVWRAATVFVVATLLAAVGVPTLLADQYVLDQDKTEQINELRVVRTNFDAGTHSRITTGDTILKIGDEHIRGADHLDELYVHFKGRTVSLETKQRGADESASTNLTRFTPDNNQNQVESANAVVYTYGLTAPVVGAVTGLQIAAAAPAVFTDILFSGQSTVLDNMSIYGMLSAQYLLALFIIVLTITTLIWTMPRFVYHSILQRLRKQPEHYRGE